jgi:hypothetical protein
MQRDSMTIYGAVADPPKDLGVKILKQSVKSTLDRIRYRLGESRHLDYKNYVLPKAYNKGDLAIALATAQKVRSLIAINHINLANWGSLEETPYHEPILISGSGYIHIDEQYKITKRVQNDLALISSKRRPYALHGIGVNMSASNFTGITNEINSEDSDTISTLISSAIEVSVRDKSSQSILEDISGRKITIVADPALFLESEKPTCFTNKINNAPTVGITIPFHGPSAALRIRRDLGKYIKFFKNFQKITNCNFIQTIHFDSEFLIGKIMQDHGIRLSQAIGDVQTLLDAYKKMDLHIGGMLHSCILSASVGTPCVGLAYDIKHQGFFDLLGQPDFCIPAEPFDPERLLVTCERALSQTEFIRAQINTRRAELEVESDKFLARTLQVLLA